MRKSTAVRFGSVRVRTPPVVAGQRIGVLGGTFNPPHAGHVLISRTAIKRLALDQLWWVVTPGNPLKSNGELPPLESRMEACRALVKDRKIKVTGFEAELGTPYTAATLAFLRTRYPAVHFVWIMGADNLAGFHRWQQWRDIMRLMPIAVVDRPGWRHRSLAAKTAISYADAFVPERLARGLPTMKPPAWTLLTGPLSALSSTALRARVQTAAAR
jgi:nicotinate-nucleotide adenylyltransferase